MTDAVKKPEPELIQVHYCEPEAKLILTFKVPNGKKRQYKSVVDKEDALLVAKSIGWKGEVIEVETLQQVGKMEAEADGAAKD